MNEDTSGAGAEPAGGGRRGGHDRISARNAQAASSGNVIGVATRAMPCRAAWGTVALPRGSPVQLPPFRSGYNDPAVRDPTSDKNRVLPYFLNAARGLPSSIAGSIFHRSDTEYLSSREPRSAAVPTRAPIPCPSRVSEFGSFSFQFILLHEHQKFRDSAQIFTKVPENANNLVTFNNSGENSGKSRRFRNSELVPGDESTALKAP